MRPSPIVHSFFSVHSIFCLTAYLRDTLSTRGLTTLFTLLSSTIARQGPQPAKRVTCCLERDGRCNMSLPLILPHFLHSSFYTLSCCSQLGLLNYAASSQSLRRQFSVDSSANILICLIVLFVAALAPRRGRVTERPKT
jgi:hypothetical protein